MARQQSWKQITTNQLSGLPAVSNNTGMNALSTMQPQQSGLLTGKNPNPKFPRARDWWERTKKAGGNFLFGQPGEYEQVQNFTPEQQNILRYLQQLGIQGLEDPYAEFDPIAEQTQNQFNQQTVPGLAERFSSLGNNALSSPAFTSQLGQAGAGLQGDLSAQRAQYGQQNRQQMLQLLLGLATQPQFQNVYRPGENGLLQNALLGGLQAAPGLYQSRQISNAIKSLMPQG